MFVIATLLLFSVTAKATEIWMEKPTVIKAGDTFNVTFFAESEDVIGGYDIDKITWNKNIITAKDLVRGNDTWSLFDDGTINEGNITGISTCCGDKISMGKLTLFTVIFEAKKKGPTDIRISGYMFDWTGLPVSSKITNITLTIQEDQTNGGGTGGGNGGGTSPPPVNKKPVAIIDTLEQAYANETITFSAVDSYDPDGTIVNYKWHFGNEIKEGQTVEYVFTKPDIYTIVLTVTDDKKETDTATEYIFIMEKPIPVDNTDTNGTEPNENETEDLIDEPDENVTNYTGDVVKENIWLNPLFIVILIIAIVVCLGFIYIFREKK